MAKKETIKINKKNGCKEFRSSFRFIGQIKPVKKKDEKTNSWVEQPTYQLTKTESGKDRRVLQFLIETAMGNELKVELGGMEFPSVYPYSSSAGKSIKVPWADRHDKTKWGVSEDDGYHLVETDWDKTESLKDACQVGAWVEVRGKYEPSTIKKGDGKEFNFLKRTITKVTPIQDGMLPDRNGELKPIKNGKDEFVYVCDFNSADFKEVNYMSMQIGIRSTYQEEPNTDCKVNAVFLMNGKERSNPEPVELNVYYTEPEEGKKSLADAFSEMNEYDFIEVIGQDNNRSLYEWIEVQDVVENNNPFADVDCEVLARKERVTVGDKKGLEITGYVAGTYIPDLLTEEEFSRTVKEVEASDFNVSESPFKEEKVETKSPFEADEQSSNDEFDPFKD